MRVSRSSTPVSDPSAHAASYSRPPEAPQYFGLFSTVKCPLSITEIRPQAMVQPKHAALVTRFAWPSLSRFSAIASAEILCAPSNFTSRMLRVGIAPISLMTFISTWVP